MFNLTARCLHDGRVECFYTDGTDDYYVGYIRQLEAGFAVRFTDHDFPKPLDFSQEVAHIENRNYVPNDEYDSD